MSNIEAQKMTKKLEKRNSNSDQLKERKSNNTDKFSHKSGEVPIETGKSVAV